MCNFMASSLNNMLTVLWTFTILLSTVAAHNKTHYLNGNDGMVHLFEWKWSDIAKECENFLGPMGFGGVQVSPIQENVIIAERPWWERYQPISYIWYTRSGSPEAFQEMVRRCNDAGVRIYVDVVFNHMTGDHTIAAGTGGSRANTYNRSYPAVPYSWDDFHTPCAIKDYNDPMNVRNCELVGLHDLNQTNEHVRDEIVNFLNAAIDAGVAGFRVDAAKHMSPKDLQVIYSRLKNLNTKYNFPKNTRPYIFQEVIDYGSETINKYEYNHLAVVTEFRYGFELSNALRGHNLLKWFVNWGEAWGLLPSKDALVFIDNHDTQRDRSDILNYKTSKLYKMAVAFMLAHPYGNPRVMSSYDFHNFNDGPPSMGNEILSPSFNPDYSCNDGWICEHRWRQIYNMIRFRKAVRGTGINNWWDNSQNQIAFCRGNRGFIAINGDKFDMKTTLFTCLPSGTYCDVISGNLENNKCTGKIVKVDKDSKAYVEILLNDEDGVLAIHKNARLK